MKKILSLIAVFLAVFGFSQELANINSGETLTYRIHYGALNAGTATLTAQKTTFKDEPHLYVKGVGKTSGAVRAFFKVDDVYESFINYNTALPSYYVRNVKEGSYSQHLQTVFNHNNNTLILTDKKNTYNGSKLIKSVAGVQDMLSAFYFLRTLDQNQLKVGTTKNLNVWIDDELFPFQLRVTGTADVKTKFGVINCLKITPLVKSGRVFKAKEGVVLYVSNDANHIPVSITAQLAVGSITADLDSYKLVKFPLNFKKK